MPRVLIFGVTGQDGSYLAQTLLNRQWEVWGTTRRSDDAAVRNLQLLGIHQKMTLRKVDPSSMFEIRAAILDVKPDVIIYLVGQSSVEKSFLIPYETFQSNVDGCLLILEVLRKEKLSVQFINASSSEIFGDCTAHMVETSLPNPKSIYGVAKSNTVWMTDYYRKTYGLKSSSVIMGNHESMLRPRNFVISKILHYLINEEYTRGRKLELGDIAIKRDWGYAPEYMSAITKIIEVESTTNFIIATGQTLALSELIDYAFSLYSLDYRDFVELNLKFARPNDISVTLLSSRRIKEQLGWVPTKYGKLLVRQLLDDMKHTYARGKESPCVE